MAGRSRAEILIGKALREAYSAALGRLELLGDAEVPEPQAKAVARQLAAAWVASIKAETRKVQRGVGEVKAAEDDLWQQFVDEYVRLYGGQTIQAILEATKAQILDALQKGLREGKGVSEIAKEMRDLIPALSRRRAAVIARTETHSAAQFASLETAKRYPFKVVKVWNSTYDHRTRDFGEGDGIADQANHRVMNGVSVAIDEPFMVPNKWGGFDPMMFPGDQAAPAYQCVNCRCAMSYKRAARIVG